MTTMKKVEKKKIKALKMEMLNKNVASYSNLFSTDKAVDAAVKKVVVGPQVTFKVRKACTNPDEKDDALKNFVDVIGPNGYYVVAFNKIFTDTDNNAEWQKIEKDKTKVVETGTKQGVAALWNYKSNNTKDIGMVINGTGWAHSLGTYAQMCKDEGIDDIKAFVKNAIDEKKANNAWNEDYGVDHPAYDIVYTLNHLIGKDTPNEGELPLYQAYTSQAPQFVNPQGILEKKVNNADQVSQIVAGIMNHWKGNRSTPADIMAISDDLQAIVCFISEATIDATKKLPVNSIDLPFFDRMASIKLFHKIQTGEVKIIGGGNQGERRVSSDYIKNRPSTVFSNVKEHGLNEVKKYDRYQRKMVDVPDTFNETKPALYKIAFRDHAYINEYKLFNELTAIAEQAVENEKNIIMPASVIEAWNEVAAKHPEVQDFFAKMKQWRQTILAHYNKSREEKLQLFKGDTSEAFIAWDKAAKATKSNLLSTLANTMRYAYQKKANVAPIDAGRIALAVQYSAKKADAEDDTGIADFASIIAPETILALITDLRSVKNAEGETIIDMKLDVEHELEVSTDISEFVGKRVNFEHGILWVNNEVAAEFVSDEHVRTEDITGDFIIKEVEDEDGDIHYYAADSLLDVIKQDINVNYQYDAQKGIIAQIRSIDDKGTATSESYVAGILNKARNQHVHLVPYSKPKGGQVTRNAIVVDGKQIGEFKCHGDSNDTRISGFWNKVYEGVHGYVVVASQVKYSSDKNGVGQRVTGYIAINDLGVEEVIDFDPQEAPKPETAQKEDKAAFLARMLGAESETKAETKAEASKPEENVKKEVSMKEQKKFLKAWAKMNVETASLKEQKVVMKKLAALEAFFNANGTVDGFEG